MPPGGSGFPGGVPGPTLARRTRRAWLTPYLFLAPGLLLFVVFRVYPLLDGLRLSFTNARLGRTAVTWVGLANYARLLDDTRFQVSLLNSAFYTVASTLPILAVPLAHEAGAARKTKGVKKGKDVITGRAPRLPGVTTGLKLPPQGKATKVSQGTADGIARGLSEGEGWRPIAFKVEGANFKPHAGQHFPAFEINIQGTKYLAYVRNTPTAAWLTRWTRAFTPRVARGTCGSPGARGAGSRRGPGGGGLASSRRSSTGRGPGRSGRSR